MAPQYPPDVTQGSHASQEVKYIAQIGFRDIAKVDVLVHGQAHGVLAKVIQEIGQRYAISVLNIPQSQRNLDSKRAVLELFTHMARFPELKGFRVNRFNRKIGWLQYPVLYRLDV